MGIGGYIAIAVLLIVAVVVIRGRKSFKASHRQTYTGARQIYTPAQRAHVLEVVAQGLESEAMGLRPAVRAELIASYGDFAAVQGLITDQERQACLASDPRVAQQNLTALATKLRAEASRLHG